MNKKTVKRRIFLTNACMILVTLLVFLIINFAVIRIYTESIEKEFQASLENMTDDDFLESLIEDYTIHKNIFIVFAAVDAALCILALIAVSHLFTKRLVRHIMQPLNALAEGTRRIRENDFSGPVSYQGDFEFEEVCGAFNDMQQSLLAEQEKNRKYEKARTDMIAGISHDLRTPLTAIRGTIKGLIDGVVKTEEQQQKFLHAAYKRTGEMDVLLNQLFYVSRLETGNMPLTLQMIDIPEFIENYVKGKRELLENEAIELTADTAQLTGSVYADPEQLVRVFDNLLENSIKYADVKPLKLSITLRKIKEKFEITFADNGVGVPAEKLPHIFEEFYRGDEARNGREGNGLGLYIVKYLIEAMGGSVRAENGNGLVVSMTLDEKYYTIME